MRSWASLIGLFLRKSNLRSPILDFDARRNEALKELESLLPASHKISIKKHPANPIVFNLLATAAHLKNSFQTKGGHLTAYRQKLFYVRIPKAGSTSIACEMLKLILPEMKDQPLTSTQINLLADAWLDRELQIDKNFIGFTVVRHPLERLTSVYRDIFDHEQEKPFIYQNYLGGILPKNLSFEEFVYRIARIPDRLKDQHFRPQYFFLRAYQQQNISIRVLKLEQPEAISVFMKTYGMDFLHLHKSQAYNPADYYTKKSLSLAKKVYTQDFKLFGYEQNLIS